MVKKTDIENYIDSKKLNPGPIQWLRGIGKTESEAAAIPIKEITTLLTHSDPEGKRAQQAFEAIKHKFSAVKNDTPAKNKLIAELMDATKVRNNILNKSNDSVVTAALRHGHKDIVLLLEANGVNVEKAERTNNKGKLVTVNKNHKVNDRRYYKSEKAAITAAVVGTVGAIIATGGAALYPLSEIASGMGTISSPQSTPKPDNQTKRTGGRGK